MKQTNHRSPGGFCFPLPLGAPPTFSIYEWSSVKPVHPYRRNTPPYPALTAYPFQQLPHLHPCPHRLRRLSRIRCFFAIRRGAESHRHADFVLVTHRSPLSSTVFTPPERCSRCSPAACSGSDTGIHCFSPCLHTEIGNKSSYQADIFDKIQRERGKTVHFSPIYAVFSPFDAVSTVFRRFFTANHGYFSPKRPVFPLLRSGTRCGSVEYTSSTRECTPKSAVSTFYIEIMTGFVAWLAVFRR